MTPLYKRIIALILLAAATVAEIYFLVSIASIVFILVVCTAGIGLIAVLPCGTAFFAAVVSSDRWLLRYGGFMKAAEPAVAKANLSKEEQTLVDYFVKVRKEGASYDSVLPVLKKNGWSDTEIQTARHIVEAAEQLSAAPQKTA